jgi:hypothetical protein
MTELVASQYPDSQTAYFDIREKVASKITLFLDSFGGDLNDEKRLAAVEFLYDIASGSTSRTDPVARNAYDRGLFYMLPSEGGILTVQPITPLVRQAALTVYFQRSAYEPMSDDKARFPRPLNLVPRLTVALFADRLRPRICL